MPTRPNLATEQSWTEAIDELLRIRNLEDDWDGEGALAPDPTLVDEAIKVAKRLELAGESPAQRVHVGVNGTIYFEWHSQFGYREIEVVAPEKVEERWAARAAETLDSPRVAHRA